MEMECYCEPAEYDGYTSCWLVKWREARKPHRCCECREMIQPGQRYERIFSVCDGDPMEFVTCEFCANEYQRLLKEHPDLTWNKGNEDLACALVWELRNQAGKQY